MASRGSDGLEYTPNVRNRTMEMGKQLQKDCYVNIITPTKPFGCCISPARHPI
jgi:hypothetical protein